MRNTIILIAIGLLGAVSGCRSPGLPPEPPGSDATDPEQGIVEARPQPSSLTRSAFEGVSLDGASGHEHHHHGAKAKAPASPEPVEPASAGHESHGSPAPKPPQPGSPGSPGSHRGRS